MSSDLDPSSLLKQLHIDRSTPPPRSGTAKWIVILAIVILTGGIIGWFMAGNPKPVTVQTVVARNMAQLPASASVLDATGYVTARRQATVSSKITGKVQEVLIEEGQRVEADQILARLDDTDAEAQLALVNAQVVSARSQLGDLRVQISQAEREWKRQQELVSRKLSSQQLLEQAQATLDSLKARLTSQQYQIGVAEQSQRVAKVNLDNTIVRAPFTGVIIAKAAQQGEIVSPISAGGGYTRTGIGTIVDMDSLEVEVDVNESYIGRVQPNQPVETTLNAYPEWKIPSEVIAIIPTADRSKATVKVRVALKQKDPRIVPDMGARVAFLEERKQQTEATPRPQGVLVPAAALRSDADGEHLFVLKDNKVEMRSVQTGQIYGESRQILSGVQAGEQVVVSPPEKLKSGERISIDASKR